jgi:ribonucleoside-diphosphate reductase beta chain
VTDDGTLRSYDTMDRGLHWETHPMRLYRKAKRYEWDPWELDIDQDAPDWEALDGAEHRALATLTSQFLAGEEAVTLDILPLLNVMHDQGRTEETLFLTTFLADEAKHTAFFGRYFDEVVQTDRDLDEYLTPAYETVFSEKLPEAMNALEEDRSPEAITRASVTYNLFIEGVLAETGYWSYYTTLEEDDLLPGLREAIGHVQRDESRHIAYGIFLLSRMIAEHDVWDVVEETANELFEYVPEIVQENWELYQESPFSLEPEDVIEYATDEFENRMERVRKARGRSLEEIYKTDADVVEVLEE